MFTYSVPQRSLHNIKNHKQWSLLYKSMTCNYNNQQQPSLSHCSHVYIMEHRWQRRKRTNHKIKPLLGISHTTFLKIWFDHFCWFFLEERQSWQSWILLSLKHSFHTKVKLLFLQDMGSISSKIIQKHNIMCYSLSVHHRISRKYVWGFQKYQDKGD